MQNKAIRDFQNSITYKPYHENRTASPAYFHSFGRRLKSGMNNFFSTAKIVIFAIASGENDLNMNNPRTTLIQ